MKERLTNNMGLKVLAIFLAFFVWLIVSNVSNPKVSDDVEVQIEFRNEGVLTENNLTYEVVQGKRTATVYYDVLTLDQFKIKSSDFKVYADVSQLYDVTGSIPLTVEIVNNRGLIEGTPYTKPGVIQIRTEELQRKPFDLQVHLEGEEEDGYKLGSIILKPQYLYVTGAVSDVGQISSVGIKVDKSGANADFIGTTTPIFYDANGNEMSDIGKEVTLSTEEIAYQVSILKVKELGLGFDIQGNVASGYRFTGVESDIKSVSVMGMKSVLASLSTLEVPSEYLNLNGATKDVVVQVDLTKLLPEHVTIAGEGATTATITLKVEQLETRGYRLLTSDIELTGELEGWEYEFGKNSMQVDMQGLGEDLDTLDINDMKPSVDVSDLEEGIHKVELKLEEREGFSLVSYGDCTIIVSSPEETAEATASLAGETTASAGTNEETETIKTTEQ